MKNKLKCVLFFDRMLTPMIIPFVYWILLLISILIGLTILFDGGIIDFILGLFFIIASVVVLRVLCELVIVLFKISGNLEKILIDKNIMPDDVDTTALIKKAMEKKAELAEKRAKAAEEKVQEVKEKGEEVAEKAADAVKEQAKAAEESVKETTEKAADAMKEQAEAVEKSVKD